MAETEIPRRSDLRRHTTAETAIRAAVHLVESVGADPRLTEAVVKLEEARECVADFMDGIERPAAQALLAQRDERIAELDARLARWEPIVGAAVQLRGLWVGSGYGTTRVLNDAVDALSEQERSELLKEGSDG